MLERHYMQSVMRQLPEIAKHLEQIADNTKQHDFSAWNGDYSSFKERYPEVFVTEDMFAFLSVLFRSFQENGVEGVCSTIATHTHRHDVENALDQNCRQVAWCVDDFESHAEYLESNRYDGEQTYDRSKFAYALDRMVGKHDCEYGISWDTIGVYLDEHCLLGGE